MKYHRLYKCHWKGDIIIKTPVLLDDNTYKIIKPHNFKEIDKQYANVWYVENPYKWYEFHYLVNFFKKIINIIGHRYTKDRFAKSAIYDLLILIIGYIIGAYIYDNFIK